MSEHTPNTSGRGKYSKIIRGLYEAIATLETQCDRSLDERDAKIDALVTALLEIAAFPSGPQSEIARDALAVVGGPGK